MRVSKHLLSDEARKHVSALNSLSNKDFTDIIAQLNKDIKIFEEKAKGYGDSAIEAIADHGIEIDWFAYKTTGLPSWM